jgi:hypothetical protein
VTNKDVLKKLNQVGEDFGWQMGKVGSNYENGYMKAIRDCKAVFQKEDHIVEVNKMIVTNADRVRNMSNEELMEFIESPCKFIKADTYPNRNCVFHCDECIEKWLKEKVK